MAGGCRGGCARGMSSGGGGPRAPRRTLGPPARGAALAGALAGRGVGHLTGAAAGAVTAGAVDPVRDVRGHGGPLSGSGVVGERGLREVRPGRAGLGPGAWSGCVGVGERPGGEVLADQPADRVEHAGAGLAGLVVPAEDAGGEDAVEADPRQGGEGLVEVDVPAADLHVLVDAGGVARRVGDVAQRSEEHTSELQSRQYLVCRLLLEKKTPTTPSTHTF